MNGFKVRVQSNEKSFIAELMALPGEMEQATARALNKVGAQGKTALARYVRDVGYNIRIADIKRTIKVMRATPQRLTTTLVASGKPIPLIAYGARQTKKGVSVSVLKGRKVVSHAFIATMPGGHKGVFIRRPDAKHKGVRSGTKQSWHALPIQELYGPSIPDGLANKYVQQQFQQLVEDKFPELLDHEIEWARSNR